MSRRGLLVALVGLFFLASCVSCAPAPPPPPKVRQGERLFGAGATFPAPLLERWFSAYEQTKPVYINYESVGSGEGMKRFIGSSKDLTPEQLIDFGVSDSAMTDAQLAEVGRGAQLLPVTAGAVALAYNLPDFKGELRLSRDVYSEIMLGKIVAWNDPKIAALNREAALPEMPITLLVRSDSSGTTFALTNHLNAISAEWRNRFGATTLVDWPQKNAIPVAGNRELAERIAATPGGLGYVPLDYAKHSGLGMALLENKAGQFVAPSTESSAAALGSAELPPNLRLYFTDPEGASSYPIVSLSWALLYKRYATAEKAAAIRELFKWCLTAGQESSDELGYVPLPANIVTAALAAIETIEPKKEPK